MSRPKNDTRSIESKRFGTIAFVRNSRAKRISIRVRPFYDVRVTVPDGVHFGRAEDFVRSKGKWLDRQLSRVREIEDQHRWRIDAVRRIHRAEARRSLLHRLDFWSGKYGLPYNTLYVRSQTTRWGSCSSKNNISLNFQMMLLPSDLRDYVLLHELTHTKIRNHGREFWKRLAVFVPEPRKLDKKLRDIPIISGQVN